MSGPPLTNLMGTRLTAAWWGKIPSQGDFVGRRMPHALIGRWDEWLRNGMDQLRSDSGENWNTRFVQSPLWFFMCPIGILGQPMVGVIGPSMDRIGRLFPLTILAACDQGTDMSVQSEDIERFLTGARNALMDARRLPLTAQQLDQRVTGLNWPFDTAARNGDQPLIDALLDDLSPPESRGGPVHLPRVDWRSCMRINSVTSVWWVSPTPQHTHDEVIQHDTLHRRLFTRMFKGQ